MELWTLMILWPRMISAILDSDSAGSRKRLAHPPRQPFVHLTKQISSS